MEELQRLIRGSYGEADDIFAGHASDAGRARASILEAGVQKIGFQKFLDMHPTYLSNKGCNAEHIAQQLERVKDLSNYFDLD